MSVAVQQPVIRVEGLVKAYQRVTPVNGVSFTVYQGEIFGLLGPNGAGKTTMLETMIGMRCPTSGHLSVCDFSPASQRSEITKRVSIQPQSSGLFEHLTVQETLDLFSSFYDCPATAGEIIQLLGLEEKANALVKRLSGGQRQRLLVGVALIGNTDVLFLDEPTGSLDPQARRRLWDVILSRRHAGKTVILTTHSMEEAQTVCDRVAIMYHGKFLALGPPQELIQQYLPEQIIAFTADTRPKIEVLQKLPGVTQVLATPCEGRHNVRIRTGDPDATLRALLDRDRALAVHGLRLEQGTLEDVFLLLVGNEQKEGIK